MSDKWRVRHPGIGVLAYDSRAEAEVAAGTAGEVLAPVDPVQPDLPEQRARFFAARRANAGGSR
jgi:hypothetical protein